MEGEFNYLQNYKPRMKKVIFRNGTAGIKFNLKIIFFPLSMKLLFRKVNIIFYENNPT